MNSQRDSSSQPDRRLNSWKSIAAYFERDERTVKRWEAQRGLPVHRVPGAGRSSVYAYTSELAEWLKTADSQSPMSTMPLSSSPVATLPPALLTSPLSTNEDGAAEPATSPEAGFPSDSPAPQAPAPAGGSEFHRAKMLVLLGAAITFVVASFVSYRQFFSFHPIFAKTLPARRHSVSPEAEELYLQGVYHWEKRTPESLNQALDDFTQSIVRDPNYAPAYAGLANCYNLLREYTLMPAKDAYPRAIAAAKRAIALDDGLAEAHNALAFATFYWNWDAPGAESEFRRAIALNPNSVVAHHWYATFLMVLARSKDALAEIEKARSLDPQSSSILADKGLILFEAGETGQSIALLKQIETTDPAFLSPHTYLAGVYLRTHEYRNYLEEAKKAAQLRGDSNQLRIITAGESGFSNSGAGGMLRAMLAVQKELYAKGQLSAYDLASTYCLLGDRQQALDLLNVAVTHREEQAVGMRNDLCFLALHQDSSFRNLIAQVGLPALD
jgi:tetratricopeptide (TPR) repeat protein